MTDESNETVADDQVDVRRAPRYGRFLVLGAGLGAVVAFLGTALFPIDPSVGFGAVFGYFAVIAVPLGLALGGGIAILFDMNASRRTRRMMAERVSIESPVEGEIED